MELAGETLIDMQEKDPEIGYIVKLRLQQEEQPSITQLQLASKCTKILWSQWYRLIVKDGIVYRIWFGKNGEPNRTQLLAPQKLRETIMKQSHSGMCGGHMGISKTCDQVSRRAYWLGWRADTIRYCRRCPECSSSHHGQLIRQGACRLSYSM